MAPTRRTHTKSRGGCYECKRRKIKCDEQRPVCAGCQKRAINSCEYPSPGSSPAGGEDTRRPRSETALHPSLVSRAASGGNPTRTNGTLPPLAPLHPHASSPSSSLRSLGHFNMEDMNLWHTFVTQTSPRIDWAMESEIHVLSLSCDYLMHGVMSTAALYLAYLHPEQRDYYEFLSTQHQDIALAPFQSEMLHISPDNCNRVWGMSLLLLVAQYASSRPPEGLHQAPDVTSKLTSWMFCLRGTVSIAGQASRYLRAGPLGALLNSRAYATLMSDDLARVCDDEDSQSLEKLHRYITSLPSIKASTTIAEMEAYTEAIFLLRQMLAASSRSDDPMWHRSYCAFWPMKVSETYMRLLTERRAPALAIMAHYCLLLNRCHSCWYMERRARDLFVMIQQSLSEEWAPSVDHPSRVLRGS